MAQLKIDKHTKRELAGLSVEELDKHIIELSNFKDELQEYRRVVTSMYDEAESKRRTAELIETLSDDAKKDLLQMLEAQGIESAEKVNGDK